MDTFANTAYPDEMPHIATFHQDLHCWLSQNPSTEKEIQYRIFGNFNLWPLNIYTMPDFIVCSFMENSIDLQREKYNIYFEMINCDP